MIFSGREYVPASELTQARLDAQSWRRECRLAQLTLERYLAATPAHAVSEAAIADLIAEQAAHAVTRRDLKAAVITCAGLGMLLLVLAFKYLHVVNTPVPRCLHPATFHATQLELAGPEPTVEVWL